MSDDGALGFELDVCRFWHHQQVDDVGVYASQFLVLLVSWLNSRLEMVVMAIIRRLLKMPM